MIPNVLKHASGGKVRCLHVDFARARITVQSDLGAEELAALQVKVRKILNDGREWKLELSA